MAPTIVLKDGKVELVTGTPGGPRIITTVLGMILDVIDYGMNIAGRATRRAFITNGCRMNPRRARAVDRRDPAAGRQGSERRRRNAIGSTANDRGARRLGMGAADRGARHADDQSRPAASRAFPLSTSGRQTTAADNRVRSSN